MSLDSNYPKTQFASTLSYRKIATEGSQNVSVPFAVDTTTTIPHNLGYVPTAKVWYEPYINSSPVASNQVWPLSGYQYTDFSTKILNTIGYAYLDSTNLYVVLFDGSGSTVSIPLYWRIYYDA